MPCSGSTTVWWSVKKEPDSFNIYHSNQTFSKNALPPPLETGVDSDVREYHHSRVPYKEDQCYRIGSVKNNRIYPSNGVLVRKLKRTKKAYFRVHSEVFNSHDNLSFTLNVLTRDGQKDIVVDSNSLTFITRSLEDWQNGNIEFDIEDSVEGLVGVYIAGEIEPYETDDGVQQDVHQVTICVEALSESDEQTGVILTVDSPDVGVKLPAVTHKANENQTIRFGEDAVSVCLLCKEVQPISCEGATDSIGIGDISYGHVVKVNGIEINLLNDVISGGSGSSGISTVQKGDIRFLAKLEIEDAIGFKNDSTNNLVFEIDASSNIYSTPKHTNWEDPYFGDEPDNPTYYYDTVNKIITFCLSPLPE